MNSDPDSQKFLGMNSREMIKSAENHYQLLKYKLTRLVCSGGDDSYIKVTANLKTENIIVIPETYMFFKTSVNNHT